MTAKGPTKTVFNRRHRRDPLPSPLPSLSYVAYTIFGLMCVSPYASVFLSAFQGDGFPSFGEMLLLSLFIYALPWVALAAVVVGLISQMVKRDWKLMVMLLLTTIYLIMRLYHFLTDQPIDEIFHFATLPLGVVILLISAWHYLFDREKAIPSKDDAAIENNESIVQEDKSK